MRKLAGSLFVMLVALPLLSLSLGPPLWAENVNPNNDDSRYAYAENVGWINAEPLGNGGPGMQVDDFELTGWMWAENVGWISLSCKNTASCGIAPYGVLNDGGGVLSGMAWGENVGWVNFAPATAGVTIDLVSGEFSGAAWGENVGWITFASSSTHPYKVQTDWACLPPPSPVSSHSSLAVDRSGGSTSLSWIVLRGATGYDVVYGELQALRSSGGDFALATNGCSATRQPQNEASFLPTPAPGRGLWLVVRGINCGGNGSYDSGEPSQVAPRDLAIQASGNDCPGTQVPIP